MVSIPPMDAPAIAQTLYQLWLGASLPGKLHRDGAAPPAMAFTWNLLAPEFFSPCWSPEGGQFCCCF